MTGAVKTVRGRTFWEHLFEEEIPSKLALIYIHLQEGDLPIREADEWLIWNKEGKSWAPGSGRAIVPLHECEAPQALIQLKEAVDALPSRDPQGIFAVMSRSFQMSPEVFVGYFFVPCEGSGVTDWGQAPTGFPMEGYLLLDSPV